MTMLTDRDVLVTSGATVTWELLSTSGNMGTWLYRSSIPNDQYDGTTFSDVLPAGKTWAIGDKHYPIVTEKKKKTRKRNDSLGMSKEERELAKEEERRIKLENSARIAHERAQDRAERRAERERARYYASLEKIALRAKKERERGDFISGATYSIAVLTIPSNGDAINVRDEWQRHLSDRLIVRYRIDGNERQRPLSYNPLGYSDSWHNVIRKAYHYPPYNPWACRVMREKGLTCYPMI